MIDDFEHLGDTELLKKLDEAALSERLVASDEWKLVTEAAKRVVELAVNEFALKTKPDDVTHIIELQKIIRKHKFGIFKEIQLLANDGPFLYESAKKRDLELMK